MERRIDGMSLREGSESEGDVLGLQELFTGESEGDEEVEVFGFKFLGREKPMPNKVP
jgi:hypothetical protein